MRPGVFEETVTNPTTELLLPRNKSCFEFKDMVNDDARLFLSARVSSTSCSEGTQKAKEEI
jgi:hypothetical protein